MKKYSLLLVLLFGGLLLHAQKELKVGDKAPDWKFGDADYVDHTMDTWKGKVLQRRILLLAPEAILKRDSASWQQQSRMGWRLLNLEKLSMSMIKPAEYLVIRARNLRK